MFSRDDLQVLLAETQGPAVSIFLPTHVAGREVRQDPIRMRNLLNTARSALEEGGLDGRDAMAVLQPGYDLVEDGEFWWHQAEGLAVFLANGRTLIHKLPVAVDEAVHVDDRFHVRPLLPVLEADGRFAVLAVSLKNATFYEATRYGMEPVPVDRLPRGMENLFGGGPDVMGEGRERPDDRTVRTPETANAWDAPAYAGDGSQRLTTNDELVQYVKQLAATVDSYLGGTGVPLVLVADERVLGHFRAVNKYDGLVQPDIPLQPDSLDDGELHAKAYAAVRPAFERSRSDALDRLGMLTGDGGGRGVTDPAAIVTAAVNGRVETLFLREGADCWGRYHVDTDHTDIHAESMRGDRELLDFTAGNVLAKDGRVYTVPADRMPGDTAMAATLRW